MEPEMEPASKEEILRALGLPEEAVPLFLDHIAQFCNRHGGTKYYGELLALVERYESEG
jgi:hypothetical protein